MTSELTPYAKKLLELAEKKDAWLKAGVALAEEAAALNQEILTVVGKEGGAMSDEEKARQICLRYGYDYDRLRGKARDRHLCLQRAEIWQELAKLGWGVKQIGKVFNRNHGAVTHWFSRNRKEGEK